MPAPFSPDAFKTELERILRYWEQYSPDPATGGFYGRVTYANQPVPDAPRSVVVNGRILWTFSMAQRLFSQPSYQKMADRAFAYLSGNFFDPDHGGVYWSIKADGTPLATTKQMYGQAFALYGLSEYYRISKSEPALDLAKGLFAYIEKHAFDPEDGGYYEAVGREGQPIEDYILSKAPYIKSMNTHLHLIEAYTNLYLVWPDPVLKQRIKGMLGVILGRIVDDKSHRMRLFFTKDWTPKDGIISYGHDIEASWLLYETAEALHDDEVLDWTRKRCIAMAEAAATGLGKDGALHYEYDPATKHTQTDRSWWVMAEQLVGFYNAYELTGQKHFLEKAQRSWTYIQEKFLDLENVEWYTTVKEDGTSLKQDKIQFWKGPYHNARACAELWRRLQKK
jgi:cellobiose epimerase